MSGKRVLRTAGPATMAVTLAAAAIAAENKQPRRELAPLEQALGEAVGRVSVAVSPMTTAVDVCRGYRLPGFGALFVVSPRVLPQRIAMRTQNSGEPDTGRVDRELARSIAGMEEALGTASTDKDKQELREGIARMRDQQRQLRRREIAERQLERQILAFEAQVQAMHKQALQAQREAEDAMRQTLERLGASEALAGEVRTVALSSRTIPPWVNWVRAPAEDTRTPEQVMMDVRQALTTVLEQRGAEIETLEPDDVVAVAVDFVTHAGPDGSRPPARTLVVRALKGVLDAVRAGTLPVAEARKQLQVAEY